MPCGKSRLTFTPPPRVIPSESALVVCFLPLTAAIVIFDISEGKWGVLCVLLAGGLGVPIIILASGCMINFKHFSPVLSFVIIAFRCFAASAQELPAGVEVRNYTGWDKSIFINATEKPVEAVIAPAVGGRVVHFSYNGENILFENPASQGKTMDASLEPLWIGGYQCDVGPQGRDIPAHLELFQGRQGWNFNGDFAIHVASLPDTDLGVVLEKDFLLAPDTGELGVVQHMRNISDKDVSYCLWDRTLCKGGGYVFFPLNKKSRFKAGWSQRRQVDGTNYYDGEHPNALQARVLNGVLVLSADGDVTQIGADSMAGWIAYARGKLLFVKYFPCFAEGNYSDGGNTVEVYFDQRAVELSPLSPETKLAPGKELAFPEKWSLIPLSREITTWEEARKLVRKIPPSPFER